MSTETDYSTKSYCGRRGRTIKYGERRRTTASFYDYTLKRMFYLQKEESREQFCYSYGYWFLKWIHKGYRGRFVVGKTYFFNLKEIEYSL